MKPLAAALNYAARGWPVFPVGRNKAPLTKHGQNDATTESDIIVGWWKRSPDAVPAILTGEASGVVALDIDIKDNVNGWDSLEALGIHTAPETPMSHTPRGGTHCLFRWPGHFIKTSVAELGDALDIRGDRGSLILPPGPDRWWDPHCNLDTVPLAQMPAWMVIQEKPAPALASINYKPEKLTAYARAAMDGAARRILSAPAGAQQNTLNSEAYGIGQLAGGGVIPSALALDGLLWAARQVPSHDSRRPWRAADIDKLVKRAFADGLMAPREVPNHG